MSYRVRLLKRANADVDTIYVWLARRSLQGAVNWYAALLAALQDLSQSIARTSLAPEANELGIDLRQLLFKTRYGRRYRLLLLVEDEDIFVLRVRGPGQAPVKCADVTRE